MKPNHRQRLPVSKPSFDNSSADDQTESHLADSKNPKPIPKAIPLAGSVSVPRRILRKPVAQKPATTSEIVQIDVAEEEHRPFELADLFTRDFAARNSSFLVSFAFHTFVLLMFSLVLIHSTGKALIVLDLMSSPDVEAFDGQMSEIEIDVDDSEELIQAVNEDPFNSAFGEDDGDQQVVDAGDKPGQEGSGDAHRGRGDGKSAKFFGMRAVGNSFVYVLDRSGSMAYESPDVQDYRVSRFDVVRVELMNSVESLKPHQEFYVVLFSTGMKQMFNQNDVIPKPVKATKENKAKLQQWLWQDQAVGGTDPRESLKLAFKMNPDAIFMLSDGEFRDERNDGNPRSIDITKQHAEEFSPIRINSIALEDQASKANMEELSEVTGGQFRFVKVSDYIANLPVSPDELFRRDGANPGFRFDMFSWKRRHEIAIELIPMLELPSSDDRKRAETSLHRLSYGFFEPTIPSVAGDFDVAVCKKATEAWKDVWAKANAQTEMVHTTPLGLFSTLATVGKKDFLESVESIDPTSLPPLHQIALARSILEFQALTNQVNERTRGLLLGALKELNRDSKAKFGEKNFLARATQETCERRLETVLKNRRNFARRIYLKTRNKKILEAVRVEHAKDLIARYPETKLAREVSASWNLPVSHLNETD